MTLDREIATGVYKTVAGQLEGIEPPEAARVAAIRLLAKAWRNTPAISWEDRIVLLKTAFEALTGKSKTHEAGAELRVPVRGSHRRRAPGVRDGSPVVVSQ